ncbi:MAG: mechanosensitive ion channel family protein [Archangium sp.]|nr:mechanosensitive ion channel family protein [Archangium sp.]MDP3152376.1 mechanosensitive ion channel family protein [Archangium sp.]MDP3574071.1 mechanosensitive ion channel family protein [Archangium sp.]
MTFLQGNLALVLGVIAFIGAFLTTRLTQDERFKADTIGAVRWLGLFIVLRLNTFWLEETLPDEWHEYPHTAWMLALAFGVARFCVSFALWLRSRFSSRVTAKIHRDVLDFVIYVVIAIPILKTQLKLDVTTMLGTSAVLSLVLGFALQDTLGNLFSGLSLQLESPFEVGDFIRVGEQEGRVVQIAWRSTRIETLLHEAITLPNSLIAKEKVTNYTRGGLPMAIDLEFGASYSAPPNFVKAEVMEALRESPLVLNDPAPWVGVSNFGESSITYKARIFLSDYAAVPHVTDEVMGRLWYRFGRTGIEIPFPQQVVHFRTEAKNKADPDLELLSNHPLFQPFPVEEAVGLSRSALERKFGVGEEIITEGRSGSSFYVVVSGKLSVRVGTPPKEIAVFERGAAFGEMSLLTGEPRTATVVAMEDCTLLELGREVFARHLEAHPERLAQLASMIEERKAGLAAAFMANNAGKAPVPGKALDRLREIFRLRAP